MEKYVIQINKGIAINVGVSVKKSNVCEKDYVWNPPTCNCENWKSLASIIDNSAIMCDEFIELCDEKTNFNGKKSTCKPQKFDILLAFLLNTTALLIAVVIYCYWENIEEDKNIYYHFT